MTQITRKLVPMRGLILLLTVTLGAGLVLVGCGDDDTATTPAPAPPPPPPPPAPEPEPEPEPEPVAPATPTGLMVSATTETSITWTWDAVEGVIGYAVQVSADEMFDATDTIHPTAEATFTASPLPPETSVFIRVAAAGGTLEAPLLSAWTTHVTGMSAMPPPPPPAPMAPATPTGLMSESGEGSISWSWDAVEGADGYAVQVSMDEMFDDTDETTYTTETTHSVADLGYGEARFARVASTSGMGDDMLTSMWTTHTTGMSAAAPPPPPAPEAPAAPTGLTSESGDGSISWSWEAVEGADGYAVQVSMDEMFGDEETTYTMETTHSVADLGYAATRYARVASTSGTGDDMLMSGWTTHVTGTSAMAPPPPPPAAIEVAFSLSEDADDQNFMVALDGGDEETAMAKVNTGIMVESNVTVIITPNWIDGAAGVTVMAMDDNNMPFAYVDWGRLQADVVSDGATFMVQRATVGANQEMEPTGDVKYVTCGPFECANGMDAPDVTIENSMACTMWEPTLELQVGLIDNSLDTHSGAAYILDDDGDAEGDQTVEEVTVFDGLDLGWHYTSSLDVDITHDLAVVSDEGAAKKTSSTKSLPVGSIGKIQLGQTGDANLQIYYALSASPDETITGASDGVNVDVGSCQPAEDETLWDYNDNLVSRISKPDDCFRLTVDHGLARNYLDAYTVEFDPNGADVAWGEIAWEAWEKLTCAPMDFSAMEQVDVCAMFEEEVDRLPTPDAVPVLTTEADATEQSNIVDAELTLAGFNLEFEDAADSRHRFVAMWYGRTKTDGKAEMPPPNLYATVVDDGETDHDDAHTADMVSGYDATVWVKTLDKDFDPIYGDLGKVDLGGNDKADTFETTDDSNACSADDGGTAKGAKVDNGTLCDADGVEIETTVTFPLGLGYGCDAVEKTYTLTCDWSTRGNRTNAVGGGVTALTAAGEDGEGGNVDDFVSCEVE